MGDENREAFLAQALGAPFRNHRWFRIHRATATNAIYRGRSASGPPLILKVVANSRALQNEVRGLRHWGPAAGWRTPELLAADETRGVLVMEDLAAVTLADDDAGLQACDLRAAGAALARLHGLDVPDDDPMPFAEAWERRCASGLGQAEALGITPERRRRAEEQLRLAGSMTGVRRRPCHRDFRPRNWMRRPEGESLAVIDFEQSRLDDPVVDFVRFFEEEFCSERRAAFREGYGRSWSEAEELRFCAYAILHALSTLSWAQRHGDVRFVSGAERRLQELGI